ncbi:MAG: hypothetical protein WAM85_13570 [Terracidiphilus sp.]
MSLNRYAIAALALCVGTTGLVTARAYGAPPAPPSPGIGIGQDRGWDVPPGELNEYQRRGFHDGIEGARKDFLNHRRPDVDNRDEYRHPHLPPEQREAYRDGFRRGYDRAMRHLMGEPDRR